MAFALLKVTAFILGDFWTRARAEQSRQNDISLAERVIELGGSRHLGIEGSGALDVPEYSVGLRLDGVRLSGFTIQARVESWVTDAAITVQPRIYDVTAVGALATGTAHSGTSPVEEVIPLTLPAAIHFYRLQAIKGGGAATTHLAFCKGVIEIISP